MEWTKKNQEEIRAKPKADTYRVYNPALSGAKNGEVTKTQPGEQDKPFIFTKKVEVPGVVARMILAEKYPVLNGSLALLLQNMVTDSEMGVGIYGD